MPNYNDGKGRATYIALNGSGWAVQKW
ncbi:hypothetical protein JCM3774_000492 [Rhodotorula dairenensis]